MPDETPIAKTMRVTQADPQGDAACRKLLSHKIFLAWIMKECLDEYKALDVNEIAQNYIEGQPWVNLIPTDTDETNPAIAAQNSQPQQQEAIQGQPNEDTSQTEGKVVFDILFYALKPGAEAAADRRLRLYINVEAQGQWYQDYPLLKRGGYYTSRMIASQKGRDFFGSDYDKISKVVSIWICMNVPKYWQNIINCYGTRERNIVGSAQAPQEQYDLQEIVLVCLGPPQGDNYNGILEMLEILLSEQRNLEEKKRLLQEKFQIQMSSEMQKEVQNMGSYGLGMFEKGRLQGREQGLLEGKAEGREQGLLEGKAEGEFQAVLASIQSLIITLRLSAEQAMDALSIPQEERDKYLPHIKHLN